MSYCGSCGMQIGDGHQFCSKCGSRQSAMSVHPTSVSSSHTETMQPTLPPPQAVAAIAEQPSTTAGSGTGCRTIAFAAIAVVLVVGAMVVGGVTYLGYKAKNKIADIRSQIGKTNSNNQSADPSKGLSALGNLLGDKSADGTNYDEVPGSFEFGKSFVDACPEFAGPLPADAPYDGLNPAKIPLKPGLILVDAWQRFNGDVEGVVTVAAVERSFVRTETVGLGFAYPKEVEGRKHTTYRSTCRTDLDNGRYYQTEWAQDFPEIFPGTTYFTMPTQMFRKLKSSGRINWAYVEYTVPEGTGRFVPEPIEGELVRIEPQDVPYDVILNGQPTQLPTIHVNGTFHFGGDERIFGIYAGLGGTRDVEVEAYILDNPDNPICLLFRKGPDFQLRFVKITVPQEKPHPLIEQQLRESKKAITYGINFDFNKDTIKPESEPVLKEIAQAMSDNPDWKLMIGGYTDNIGGDKYNLDLSQRRAAAVKRALVDRYHEDPNRLSSAGHGESSPVDTNDTLEGRARNRRVELTLD
jgi:outer membrane protein OmpA-like peptidoglycan-associated protein